MSFSTFELGIVIVIDIDLLRVESAWLGCCLWRRLLELWWFQSQFVVERGGLWQELVCWFSLYTGIYLLRTENLLSDECRLFWVFMVWRGVRMWWLIAMPSEHVFWINYNSWTFVLSTLSLELKLKNNCFGDWFSRSQFWKNLLKIVEMLDLREKSMRIVQRNERELE